MFTQGFFLFYCLYFYLVSLLSAFTVTVKIRCHEVYSHLNTYFSKDPRTQTHRAGDRKDSASSAHHLYHFFKSKFP